YLPKTNDVSKFFAIADLHLFVSHREGFGNVAIEAAASGVPTVAYNVIGIMDSVRDDVSGYKFKFGENKKVAEFIDLAAFDRPKFNRAYSGSIAREWAVNNFEQKMVWNGYKDFFLKEAL